MPGVRSPRTRLSRSERSDLALSEPLPSGLLRMIYDGFPGQYAGYPVIPAQTPETLDWLSSRDNDEITELIHLCLPPAVRRERRLCYPRRWIRVRGRRI